MPQWVEVRRPGEADAARKQKTIERNERKTGRRRHLAGILGERFRGRTSNDAELSVAAALIADGYEILKSGWPDFIALRDSEVRFIEVKPNPTTLKGNQRRVADILATFGMKVEVFSPAFADRKRVYEGGSTVPVGPPRIRPHAKRIPATKAQVDYLRILVAKKGTDQERLLKVEELGKRQASRLIDSLLGR